MPRLVQPRVGKALRNPPNGIPLFFERRAPRVVTADPWAFFRSEVQRKLVGAEQARACAYIVQAHDFSQAAENPEIGSKPLLYYYCFLNLAKVAILLWGTPIPLRLMHGIEDPKANIKQRIRVSGQQIRFRKRSSNNDQAWAELWRILGGDTSDDKTVRLVDVLAQVPTIHRTFTSATQAGTTLLPIHKIDAFNDGSHVWLRVAFKRHDRDVELTLPTLRRSPEFIDCLHQVASASADEIWFETSPEKGTRRGIEPSLRRLTEAAFQVPTAAILTSGGYRYYFSTVSSAGWLHPAAAIYAAMFYLGSVTRYKPDVFGKLLSGGYAWVVQEFLATAPMQFIYLLASVVAGCEVVRPHAAIT